MRNIKLQDPRDKKIKFYKEQLRIFRKEIKELKKKAKEAAILIEKEYNSKPFHNNFTYASDFRLSEAYVILTGEYKMAITPLHIAEEI